MTLTVVVVKLVAAAELAAEAVGVKFARARRIAVALFAQAKRE